MKYFHDTFNPENYNLFIDLRLANERKFSGSVIVSGEAKQADYVSLHSKDLIISEVTNIGSGETLSFDILPKEDELRIYLSEHNSADDKEKLKIEIKFSGEITDSMHGLYPCYYNEEGEQKEMFATQFESHHAREVFPCIDEPNAKATLDVKLLCKSGYSILGNTPGFVTNDGIDSLISFEQTPIMSTYLLAFAVGDLQKKTATTKNGTEVSVWSTKAQDDSLLDFPLNIAVRVLEFYEDYFNVKFPLKKCDHLALPDFSSGAMENWGLITYRETALLANDKSSISSRKYVALVIAHETAHQWFGNLVTMKWWDDLWLNESFANMMEYLAVDALEPSWNIWQEFAVNEAVLALRRDAISGVQSVHIPVTNPEEIDTIFDGAIVYAKGARLMKMLRAYVGEDSFRQGLTRYFNKFTYKNAIGDDLWQSLSEVSNLDVGSFIGSWLDQPGYPVLKAGYDKGVLTLSQNQFFIGSGDDYNRKWPIMLGSNNANLPYMFDEHSSAFEVDLKNDYLKFNADNNAHYIVNYDNELLTRLVDNLDSLDVVSRLQILQERSLLAKGGEVNSVSILKTLDAYKNEDSLSVWDMMNISLGEMKIIAEDAAEDNMRKFTKKLVERKYQQLGFYAKTDDTEEDIQLRPMILAHMIYTKDESATNEAVKIYNNHESSLFDIDSEIRSIVIAAKIKIDGSLPTIKKLINLYTETIDTEFRDDLASAITTVRNSESCDYILEQMKNPRVIRSQDVLHWFIYLVRNSFTRRATWSWLKNNWQWVEDTFGSDKSYSDFIRYAGSILRTREHLNEFRQFFNPMKDDLALLRSIDMGEKEITARVELIERDQPEFVEALNNIVANS